MTTSEREACTVLRADLADHRIAMARLLEQGQVDLASTLLVHLYQFCHFQLVPEGNAWAAELAVRIDNDAPLASEVLGAAALSAWFAGRLDDAIELGQRSVRIAEEGAFDPPFWALLALVDSLGYAGRLHEVGPSFRALVLLSRASPTPFWKINGLGYEVISLLMYDRGDDARERAELLLDSARGFDHPDCLHWALHCYGRAYAHGERDLLRAASALQEAIEVTRSVDSRWHLSLDLLEWAGVARRLGEHAAAADALDELLELIRSSGNRSQLAAALGEVGQLLAATGDVAGAAFALLVRSRLPAHAPTGGVVERDVEALLASLESQSAPAAWARLQIRSRSAPEHEVISASRTALAAIPTPDRAAGSSSTASRPRTSAR
jgi:tetratricopeptide (TPR) repeat protein